MVDEQVRIELMQALAAMPVERQREVLAFALKPERPKGTPGSLLLKFGGTLNPEAAEEMRQAIEEGCGQVNPHGW